ncbi:hypothetical protein R1sor_010977 [Riccia sorocarpa]|uniref:Uncharacterized protein n=1 Tax=Riccia sorocarpa TaxID=122646 RepID=A0ABD3I0Z2_9MARC
MKVNELSSQAALWDLWWRARLGLLAKAYELYSQQRRLTLRVPSTPRMQKISMRCASGATHTPYASPEELLETYCLLKRALRSEKSHEAVMCFSFEAAEGAIMEVVSIAKPPGYGVVHDWTEDRMEDPDRDGDEVKDGEIDGMDGILDEKMDLEAGFIVFAASNEINP